MDLFPHSDFTTRCLHHHFTDNITIDLPSNMLFSLRSPGLCKKTQKKQKTNKKPANGYPQNLERRSLSDPFGVEPGIFINVFFNHLITFFFSVICIMCRKKR